MARYRAEITKTLRILDVTREGGSLVSEEDVPIYCKKGTLGYFDTEEGLFESDSGEQFYPPLEVVHITKKK